VTDLSTVSSDDVIASYQQQLSDAHHRIAILEAKLAKAMKYINEQHVALPEPADGGKK
jgi:hypothetical protein